MASRLVVTGHNAKSRSVIVHDAVVEGMTVPGGVELNLLWSADAAATYPDGGDNPSAPGVYPSLGGYRFMTFTVMPDFVPNIDAMPDDLAESMEVESPGMHTSDTTDFDVVLSGQVLLELDDGVSVVLSAGDTVVQNGTRHAWRAHGDTPAVIAVFMVGANRSG
jgi:mannose-6-phosphate isomerase-like protein (cupin superfamily)